MSFSDDPNQNAARSHDNAEHIPIPDLNTNAPQAYQTPPRTPPQDQQAPLQVPQPVNPWKPPEQNMSIEEIQRLLSRPHIPNPVPPTAPTENIAVAGAANASSEDANPSTTNPVLKFNMDKRDQLVRASRSGVMHWLKDQEAQDDKEDSESKGVDEAEELGRGVRNRRGRGRRGA
jgi:hypothetical protein